MEPEWLKTVFEVPQAVVYLLLFLTAVLENLFPLAPGDTVTVFGGYLAGLGRLSLPLAYVLVTAGSWGGFMVYYFAGRWLGRTRVHALLERWFSSEQLYRAEAWFRRHGAWVVLANRYLAGTRSVISVTAGFVRMPSGAVAVFAFLSCATWNVLLMGAGYVIGDEWSRVTYIVSTYNTGVFAALTMLGLAVLLRWWQWRRRR